MTVTTIIKLLLEVLIEYLKLRNRTYYYDMVQRSRIEQKKLIDEIETLRKSKLNSDHDRADLLRGELLLEQGFAEHLSTFYIKFREGENNKNP